MSWPIGSSTGCCVECPILGVLDAIHQVASIRGVEVGTPPRHFDPWQHSQIDAVRGFLEQSTLAPISIHAPFGGLLDLSDTNPHHRHAAVGAILTAAAALKALGGSIVVVHTTDVPRHDQDVQQRLSLCAGSLIVLTRAIEQMRLRLAIESPLPHLIGGDADEFAWILGQLDGPAGVCLDTAHTTLGHQWDRFLNITGDRLIHLHANDHRGQYDDHLPPGDGIIDWKRIADGLRAVNYEGWIMLELGSPEGAISAHIARAYEQAARLLV